ncbi:MAG: aldo/keto reductase, partial [Anaerolineales bacterium]|nr:aldo/keto reductase [Anaerolineales bacterium]
MRTEPVSNLLYKIVLGTAQFGMNYGIANSSGRIVQEEVSSILNFAWENGIKCLDTAAAYGAS